MVFALELSSFLLNRCHMLLVLFMVPLQVAPGHHRDNDSDHSMSMWLMFSFNLAMQPMPTNALVPTRDTSQAANQAA
ncbi:hypothetical protein THAOC_00668 [Thalassiosira oceanica]|uniref:Secreted protein n=1 Tax=Thalassiosira oceanica TaxID=159749 RepID=K0TRB3_THAOC|nr:hypothetical protein THAOC_00668 [Thalassiosira oceanica]|eukprot:EJK77497.1 hypothetical protein THAOC_00668 [Thalassiosira oceanica]